MSHFDTCTIWEDLFVYYNTLVDWMDVGGLGDMMELVDTFTDVCYPFLM